MVRWDLVSSKAQINLSLLIYIAHYLHSSYYIFLSSYHNYSLKRAVNSITWKLPCPWRYHGFACYGI